MKGKRCLQACLRWTGWSILVVLCLAVIISVYMVMRERGGRDKNLAEYPPAGQMVSLGTHGIHIHCVGSGNPTVVFESDIDQLGSLSWALVQSEVEKFTRACSYDRAGIMWSEPGPLPRDGLQIANELREVLNAAGEDSPYIMVGHAMGGAYVRIFAGQNPEAVCGMVLVDSSHPEQLSRFAGLGIEKELPNQQFRPLILLLSSFGIPGLNKGPQYSMPDEVYEAEQAFLSKSSLAWFDESSVGTDTLFQAGQYEYLGDIPLIVLSSARPSMEIEGINLQDEWLELQQELTSLSKNSELRKLEESGHYIQFDQPQAVVDAVRDVVQQCEKNLHLP